MTSAPLLRASGARIESEGVVLSTALSFEANGDRVGLIGDVAPLVLVLARSASVTRGSAELLGRPLDTATRSGHVGFAFANPPLPATWTTNEYLRISARLLGLGWWQARREVNRTLARLELKSLAKRRLGMLRRSERIAVGIAHASLGAPDVVWFDRPFDGLSDEERETTRAVVERAATGRRLILSSGTPAAHGVESAMFASMNEVVTVVDGAVVAANSRAVVRAARSLGALSAALVERGVRVEPDADVANDAGRLVVTGASSALIVEAALEAEAPLLELRALPGAVESGAAADPLGPKNAAT